MKLAVLVLLAACGCRSLEMHDQSRSLKNKPGVETTANPNKQVEYVTGPNVGILGPTVLGGKGQEVQPSIGDVQSSDKAERDVSGQGPRYSGFQELPAHHGDSKGQTLDEADLAKYSVSLSNYGSGDGRIKYPQGDVNLHSQYSQYYRNYLESNQGKGGSASSQNANGHRAPTTKVTYYQSEEQFPQTSQPDHNVFNTRNPEQQTLAHLLAHIRSQTNGHQPNQAPSRGTQYISTQAQEEDERTVTDSPETSKPEASSDHAGQPEDDDGQTTSQESSQGDGDSDSPQTNDAQGYVPQEYLQYQLAGQEPQLADVQSSFQYPGKHQLQVFLPQEGISGPTNIQSNNPQVTQTLQNNVHLHSTQNGHQLHYIPAFYRSQSQSSIQNEHHPQSSPNVQAAYPQHPQTSQIPQNIRHPHNPSLKQSQISAGFPSIHSPTPPSTYRPHILISQPQFQPNVQHQRDSIRNDQSHYQGVQQPNLVAFRPQTHYVQVLNQNSQPQLVQYTSKPSAKPQSNGFNQPLNLISAYRQRLPERFPQRPSEHLSLISPHKSFVHRQPSDKPLHNISPSDQSHHSESSLSSNDKPDSQQQGRPFNIQKPQAPLQLQSPTPYPVKVLTVQQQVQFPLTSSYKFSNDKIVSHPLRPVIYPNAVPDGQHSQSDIPYSSIQTPTEAPKFYHVKIPSFIKSLEQHSSDPSKPFGFAQTTFGQKTGSYSYSIFNKHS